MNFKKVCWRIASTAMLLKYEVVSWLDGWKMGWRAHKLGFAPIDVLMLRPTSSSSGGSKMVLGIKYGRVAYLQRWEHHQQLEEETGFCLITVQLLGYCVGALNTLMMVMVMMVVLMLMVMVMGIITVHLRHYAAGTSSSSSSITIHLEYEYCVSAPYTLKAIWSKWSFDNCSMTHMVDHLGFGMKFYACKHFTEIITQNLILCSGLNIFSQISDFFRMKPNLWGIYMTWRYWEA